jgi:uncharacterized protein YidB (DUF937 family)
MGFLDAIENLAQQQTQASNQPQTQPQGPSAADHARVAGGLMQALDEHPGGLQSVLESFRSNGMSQSVQDWATGQQPTATPQQIQQGLGGTGLIDRTAQKAGVSPQTAELALATILPLVISHFTHAGQASPPGNGYGGMASEILGRFL